MTLTPELLSDLRKKAHVAKAACDAGGPWAIPAGPEDILALLDRIAELERVAKAVEGTIADVALNGRRADAPIVSQGEADELLAIIRKGRQ
jgi:hypothetical protein